MNDNILHAKPFKLFLVAFCWLTLISMGGIVPLNIAISFAAGLLVSRINRGKL